MNYIIAILVMLLILKVLEMQKRISELEAHDPAHSRKKPEVLHPGVHGTGVLDGQKTWVIPDMRTKHAA